MNRLRRNPALFFGGTIVLLIVVAASLGQLAAPADPFRIDLGLVLAGPRAGHPLGCDALGRDVLARILWGARLSLAVSGTVILASLAIGITIGGTAAVLGGYADALLMRTVDVLLAFPGILLAIALAASLGPGLADLVIALAAIGWTGYARLVRGEILSLRERDYVEAAVALGARRRRLLLRHLLPALAGPVAVQASFGIGGIIVAEAALSFLGLGPQPPFPSWGNMLDEGRAFLLVAPHLTVTPGLAIGISVLGFNFLGDGLAQLMGGRN